jgi:hypothetical protein
MMKQSLKHRRSEKQIRLLLEQQQTQNISVIAFCKAHNIHKATFYNWRNKFGLAVEQPQFVPVQFAEAFATTATTAFAEIVFSSNIVVKIFQQVDASWFKPLRQP